MNTARRFALLLACSLMLQAHAVHADITRVGATSFSSAKTDTKTLSISAAPSGTTSNDLLLIVLSVSGPALTSVTAPAGFSSVNQSLNSGHSQVVFRKFASASESGPYTVSWNYSGSAAGNDRAMVYMLVYRGVDTSAPIAAADKQFNSTSSSSVTAPSITPGVANTQLVGLFAIDRSGGAPVTLPSGMGNGLTYETGAGPGGITLTSADEAWSATTATNTRVATFSASSKRTGQLIALKPAAVALDHIRIEHSGTAITCAPAMVTVKACADSSCGSVAATDVSVTLSPSGWSGGDSITIPANSSSGVTRSLAITSPQTVTLSTSSVSPAPTNTARCFVGGSETCALQFVEAGFIFSTVGTQTAGTTTSGHTLQAVRTDTDTGACSGVFTGNVNIELASQCSDPTTCAGPQVAIAGTAIAANPAAGVTSYSSVTLNFGSDSTASFSFNYGDVGRISLSARYDLGSGVMMSGTSNLFVVKPAGFSVTGIKRTSDALANPAASTATGTAFIQAGADFTATITALTSGGATTPNFGNEIDPEDVSLTSTLLGGLGLTTNPGLTDGNIEGEDFISGVATPTDLRWDEAGIITLTPSNSDYLGAGEVVGTTTGNIGRFTPHHFDVEVDDSCATASFTYSSQPFTANVYARRSSGATTQNYAGDFAKTVTLSRAVGSGGSFADNTIAGTAFTAGLATSTTPAFTFAAPPELPLQLFVRATDTDSVSSETYTEGDIEIRSGRLRLVNAFGSGQAALNLPMRLETWQTISGSTTDAWMTETTDSCTAALLNASMFSSSWANTSASVVKLYQSPEVTTETYGTGFVTLAKPTPSAAGSSEITAVLDSVAKWLKFDWDGNGSTDNPKAKAGFELNPGNRRQIYTREVIGN